MRKKWLFILLASAMVAAQPCAYAANEPVITQEELEKLKLELQKEIDEYEQECMEMIMTDEAAAGMSYSLFSSKNTMSNEAFEADAMYPEYFPDFNTEEYNNIKPNEFQKVSINPLSTFAADVDTGSYCNLRRLLKDGTDLSDIPDGAVRTEELLNYFDYSVEEKKDGKFSVQHETAECPWDPEHELLLMTVQANEQDMESKGNNFVYLIDTSGSMDEAEKIALAKCSFKLLSYTLTENDRVSIVTYSGDSYVALEGCKGNDYEQICDTLDEIIPYGGTNGSGGIEEAYRIAQEQFIEGGNNRVFIASDGDMNLGVTSQSGLVDLIEKEKESGIFLTVLGYGTGNYSDANMESIADAGNGNYFYIDCLDEAQHVLIENQKEVALTVAKDVKYQAEFNPAEVSEYRLLGYENRAVSDSDFENDAVDGGEVGAGQQVTILYEIVKPDGTQDESRPLKYQEEGALSEDASSGELLTLSINYKEPDSDESVTESIAVKETDREVSEDMNLAISLAELSMLIHDDDAAKEITMDDVKEYAAKSGGELYRMKYQEMLDLIE